MRARIQYLFNTHHEKIVSFEQIINTFPSELFVLIIFKKEGGKRLPKSFKFKKVLFFGTWIRSKLIYQN